MKFIKMLGLLAVAAATLMAFAGSASATTATSPEGTTYTGEITATSTNSEMAGAFVTVKCNHSEVKSSVEGHGSGKEVGGKVSSLTFTGCNYSVTVKAGGSLSINSSKVVISAGASVEIHTSVGTCVFTTNATVIGSLIHGISARFRFSARWPRTGGNFLCGSSGELTGDYDLTTPNDLWVD